MEQGASQSTTRVIPHWAIQLDMLSLTIQLAYTTPIY